MAKLPHLAEWLAHRHGHLAHSAARHKQPKTRAERVLGSPREPRSVVVLYLRTMARIMEDIQATIKAEVIPRLPELLGQTTGVSAPPRDGRIGTRVDGLPGWYAHALRYDAADRYSRKLGDLELTLRKKLEEKNLAGPLSTVGKAIYDFNSREMTRILRINLRDNTVGLQDFIKEFTERNVRLIQSVAADQVADIEQRIAAATTSQTRVEDLADEIKDRFQVSDARAALIARDQTLKSNAALSQTRQKQAGVKGYIWTISGDERVRGRPGGKWANSESNHWVLDGTRQTWDDPPVTNPVTGARNHPGEDYQCRCTATPILDELLGPEDDTSDGE